MFQAAKNDREDFLRKCLERGESVTKVKDSVARSHALFFGQTLFLLHFLLTFSYEI